MTKNMPRTVELVEVGPRDGLQGIAAFVPTADKMDLIARSVASGIKRVEIGSFVSAKAVPQMADTPVILDAMLARGDVIPQVLVPNRARGEDAAARGAPWLAYVLSASNSHNQANLKRSVEASLAEVAELCAALGSQTRIRLNIATAFDCPFEGATPAEAVLSIIAAATAARGDLEICLCDTTGRANPAQVATLFAAAMAQAPSTRAWAFHGHDTYGMGLANIYAAYLCGTRIFDAAFAGLGGCPFAPGATGNVATEDVAFMFDAMGVHTGVDFPSLIAIAEDAARIPGGQAGGRVRMAFSSTCNRAPALS